MKSRRLSLSLAAATLFAAPSLTAVAMAQTSIRPGMQVLDPAGGAVGTVTRVKGTELTVKTDQHEVTLPTSSFTPDNGKLLFALTREQLNTQTEQAIAEANAKLIVGAPVRGQAGSLAGQIEAIDDRYVTVKLTSGERVRLPRTAVAAHEDGAVLGISAEELRRLAKQAS